MALHYAVAGACVVAFISTPIAAADLGGVTPTSLRFDGTAPAPIWTGLYIGADGGFSFASGAPQMASLVACTLGTTTS